MSPRITSAAVSVLVLAGGCTFLNAPPPNGAAPQQTVAAPATQPAPTEAAAGEPATKDADKPRQVALATEAYARRVQEQLEARAKKAPATRPTEPGVPAPADIKLPEIAWLKSDVRLSLGPPQDPRGPSTTHPATPTTRPSSDNSTAANEGAAVPDAPSAPPAAPLATNATRTAAPAVDPIELKLAELIKSDPRDAGAQLDYQLLQLVNGKTVPQMDRLASLSEEDREVLAAVMDALSGYRGNLRNESNMLLSRRVRPLIELGDRLRAQADLRIPTLALCTKVNGFGVYEPVESDRLQAGRDNTVIVYCEVENFSSHITDQKQWETNLTQEAVLYNERGQRAWEEKRRPVTDFSRNRRRDFFMVRMVRLPASLAAGKYTLKVTVGDTQSGRVAESSATVQIVTEK